MYIRALKPFTEYRSDGTFFSPAAGSIFEVTSEKGAELVENGLAEEYTLITPSGTKTITQNGVDIDVVEYAKVDVAVPAPSGSLNIAENGTFDVSEYAEVVVNVGGSE